MKVNYTVFTLVWLLILSTTIKAASAHTLSASALSPAVYAVILNQELSVFPNPNALIAFLGAQNKQLREEVEFVNNSFLQIKNQPSEKTISRLRRQIGKLDEAIIYRNREIARLQFEKDMLLKENSELQTQLATQKSTFDAEVSMLKERICVLDKLIAEQQVQIEQQVVNQNRVKVHRRTAAEWERKAQEAERVAQERRKENDRLLGYVKKQTALLEKEQEISAERLRYMRLFATSTL